MSAKTISKASRKLTALYSNGIIKYARVDSDYSVDNKFALSAHPSISSITRPLVEPDYEYSKKTAYLELNNVGLLTPALFLSRSKKNTVVQVIDKFFDDEMKPIKKIELEDAIVKFNFFIDGVGEDEKNLNECLKIEKAARPFAISHFSSLQEAIEISSEVINQNGTREEYKGRLNVR